MVRVTRGLVLEVAPGRSLAAFSLLSRRSIACRSGDSSSSFSPPAEIIDSIRAAFPRRSCCSSKDVDDIAGGWIVTLETLLEVDGVQEERRERERDGNRARERGGRQDVV